MQPKVGLIVTQISARDQLTVEIAELSHYGHTHDWEITGFHKYPGSHRYRVWREGPIDLKERYCYTKYKSCQYIWDSARSE